MDLTDGQLVAKAASGDDSAFDELVSRYRTRVYHLALSKVRGRDNAMDLAQETFVQAYLSLTSIREPERFGAWLSGITANLCKMHLRTTSEVPMAPEMVEELRMTAEPDPNAALARAALDRLPNGTRSAAVLFFVEGMRQAEIAEFLGISLAAVKSRIRDARASLQKEMIHMVKQTARKDEPGDEFAKSLKHRLELARWYREFADSLASGCNLGTTLTKLRDGDYSEPIKQATARLVDKIWTENATFSDVLSENPELLTPEVLGFVKAAEHGGVLGWASQALADAVELRHIQESVELNMLCRTLGLTFAYSCYPVSATAGEAAWAFLQDMALSAQGETARVFLGDMVKAIEAGKPLASVVERHPDILPPALRVGILAGEKSGTLPYALSWAAAEIAAGTARRLDSLRHRRSKFSFKDEYAASHRDFHAALPELLLSDSASLRAEAAEALGRSGDKSVAAQIAKLIGDGNARVRAAAVSALADLGYHDAAAELIERLKDSDASVRLAAVRALGSLRHKEASPEIALLLGDEGLGIDDAAAQALEAMGDDSILAQHARELLGNDLGYEILARHGTPEVMEKLVHLLGNEDAITAIRAALALARLNSDAGVPVLLNALGRFPKPSLTEAELVYEVSYALKSLGLREEAVRGFLQVLSLQHRCYIQHKAASALAKIGGASAGAAIRKAVEERRACDEWLPVADKLESN